MKIGILTFPNSPSFGASLQMLGLYDALRDLGHDVEIINYKNTYMSEKKHLVNRNSNKVKNLMISLLDIPSKIKFKTFENCMLFYPKTTLCEKDNLLDISNRYDYLICGSDQVWNPYITGEDLHYFFDFCIDNKKKISYAASFGVNELDHAYSKKVRNELIKFKSISVREERGVEIVKNMVGNKCKLVLDPTMLLTKEVWQSKEKAVSGLPSKYIVKFIFNYDKKVEQYISELSKKTGLPIITIGGTIVSKFKSDRFTGPIGPDEWLYVLDHADYIVTDSFHGAAFSIIFNKQLFVSLASATNSRLKTLMKTFDLENNIIQNNYSINEIDYRDVEKIMNVKRNNSLDFLRNSIV